MRKWRFQYNIFRSPVDRLDERNLTSYQLQHEIEFSEYAYEILMPSDEKETPLLILFFIIIRNKMCVYRFSNILFIQWRENNQIGM